MDVGIIWGEFGGTRWFLEFSVDRCAAGLLILLFTCLCDVKMEFGGTHVWELSAWLIAVFACLCEIIFGAINYDWFAPSKQGIAFTNATALFVLQCSEPLIVILFSRSIHWLIYT